jgi:hypothetical protein
MLIYIGIDFLPGVPARDLSDEEVKQFGKVALLASGLYIEDKPIKRPVIEAEKELDNG